MNTLNTQKIKSISEQREMLLAENPDKLYGVYILRKNSENIVTLEYSENILTTCANQFPNLKWISENSDMIILDLGALRKDEIQSLNNKNVEHLENNFVLLSNGVIEILSSKFIDKNRQIQERNHFPTTLRDGGSADTHQRTSVAGRNSTNHLFEDLEREYAEENPFIGKGKDGKWTLFTPRSNNPSRSKKDLIESVKFFLENKYNLDRKNLEHLKSIRIAEQRLRIPYKDLGKILKEIIQNEQIDFFENEYLDDFEEISRDMKIVEMVDENGKILSRGKFFVYFDAENNTIEYRSLRKITIPEGVLPTARLFLESQNQWVENSRAENLASKNLVPTIRYFIEKVLSKWK